ncbi:T9SS type A sorting domain-containing protein [bacterium]|nr:T9SS type A sorting domain-containing protein [bacterium]
MYGNRSRYGGIMTARVFLSTVVCWALFAVTAAAQVEIEGSLSGTLEDTTYHVVGAITVDYDSTLVFEPGAEILFVGWYPFNVYGTLLAEGTETDTIVFRSQTEVGVEQFQTLTFSGGGASESRLTYCLIKDAYQSGVNVRDGAQPTIEHCTFLENEALYGGAISISGSSPTIRFCTFEDNFASLSGGAIFINGADPLIEGCEFTNNESENWGGAVTFFNNSQGTIRGSRLLNNVSGSTGGGIHISNSSPTVDSCIVRSNNAGNYGGGINSYSSSSPIISRTVVMQNYSGTAGGGIYVTRSAPTIDHCVIYQNDVGSWGEGIYFYRSSDAVLTNSALFGNGDDVYFFECFPHVAFNVVGTGDGWGGDVPEWLGVNVTFNASDDLCDVNYNVEGWPTFTDPNGEDFTPTAGSLVIDAGDWREDPDPDGTLPDIGAVSREQTGDGADPPAPPGTHQITGAAQLEYRQTHEEIELVFRPRSVTGVPDTAYTDVNGAFSVNPVVGVYDIFLSHEDFYPDSVLHVFVQSSGSIGLLVLLQQIPLSGTISGVLEGNGWVMTGELTVPLEDTLVIEAGAELFMDEAELVVHGLLIADGTADDPIHFHAAEASAGWDGLFINTLSPDTSRFRYCIFEGSFDRAVEVYQSSPVFEQCRFTDNFTIERGGAVDLQQEAHVRFARCIFDGNTAQMPGGAISVLNNSSANLRHCLFYGNESETAAGIDLTGGTMTLRHSIFAGQVEGQAVRIVNPSEAADLGWNCFYNNQGGDANGAVPAGFGLLTDVGPYGDSTDTHGNLFQNPLLTNPAAGAFALRDDSPCINAGDPDAPPDPDGTRADIGPLARTITGSFLRCRPAWLDFDAIVPGHTARRPLVVINPGVAELEISQVSIETPGVFAVDPGLSFALSPDQTDTLWVEFTPDGEDLFDGLLQIASNMPGNPEKTVELSGRGDPASGVDESGREALPSEFGISALYPNPFNATAHVEVALPRPATIQVRVYNALGQVVATPVTGEHAAGYARFNVNAVGWASGLYFIEVRTDAGEQTVRRLMLVR